MGEILGSQLLLRLLSILTKRNLNWLARGRRIMHPIHCIWWAGKVSSRGIRVLNSPGRAKQYDGTLVQQDKGRFMSDENQDNGGGSGFGWFLVGLGIGAAIGVLYAPQAGTDTRETLAESARERAEYLKQKSREAAAQVNTYVDAGKDQFGEYVERGKNAVATGRSQVEDYVERGRKVVAKHASKVSAAVDAGKSAYTATTAPVDERI
jgi:gas vesicle protein